MRRIGFITAVTTGLSIVLTSAAAAASWSPPAEIGPPADYVYSPSLQFTPSGFGIASWLVRSQPAGAGGLPGAVSVVAGNDNDGESGRLATLSAAGIGHVSNTSDTIAFGPVLENTGRGVLLRTFVVGSDANGYRKVRLSWSVVASNGSIGKARPLTTATLASSPAIATDARGDALAAWVELEAAHKGDLYGRNRIVAAWRPAGGTFGRPVVLRRTQYLEYEHGGSVAVAMSASGRTVVTYDDAYESAHPAAEHRNVLAWTRTPRSGYSKTLVAGHHDGFAAVAPVVTPQGSTVLVWGSQDGGEEANNPWVIRAATLSRGARGFSRVQVLDAGGGIERPMGNVVAATGRDGRVIAAWSGVRGSRGRGITFPVETAVSDSNGHFAPAATLAPMGAVGGVAVSANGTRIVAWARVVEYQETDQAMAALRMPGQSSFGAPEAIAAPDHALPPAVAFDPASGQPVVAWSARPAGADPSNGVGTTAILRISRRAG